MNKYFCQYIWILNQLPRHVYRLDNYINYYLSIIMFIHVNELISSFEVTYIHLLLVLFISYFITDYVQQFSSNYHHCISAIYMSNSELQFSIQSLYKKLQMYEFY